MSNKNVFCASNPAHILDALWGQIERFQNDFSRVLIFLPSNRAMRSVEKMIVDKIGHAVILPSLIALGNGVDGDEVDCDFDVISNQERVIILAKLLSMDANVKNIATALPLARDLVRMQDYLENEGIKISDIKEYAKNGNIKDIIISAEDIMPDLKKYTVSCLADKYLKNGNKIYGYAWDPDAVDRAAACSVRARGERAVLRHRRHVRRGAHDAA